MYDKRRYQSNQVHSSVSGLLVRFTCMVSYCTDNSNVYVLMCLRAVHGVCSPLCYNTVSRYVIFPLDISHHSWWNRRVNPTTWLFIISVYILMFLFRYPEVAAQSMFTTGGGFSNVRLLHPMAFRKTCTPSHHLLTVLNSTLLDLRTKTPPSPRTCNPRVMQMLAFTTPVAVPILI